MHRFTFAMWALLGLATMSALAQAPGRESDDPYLWLEEVQGERALAWVRERNAATRAQLQSRPEYLPTRDAIRAILDSRDRIPVVSRRGEHLYNLWQDAANPRGLWRRTTLAEYRKPAPAWETVLDLDALGKAEGKSWVWAGASCLAPAYRRCIVSLSPGGGDAAVRREFDTVEKRFVEGGFALPEAKGSFAWESENSLLVATDFGPGSLTSSGYPRVVKRWLRGTPLEQATMLYEGQASDVSAWAYVDKTFGHERTVLGRWTSFYTSELALLRADGRVQALPTPADASLSFWRDQVLLELKSEWKDGQGKAWPKGSLLIANEAAYLAGRAKWQALFTPTPQRSLLASATTRDHVLLTVLQDVASRLEEVKLVGGKPVRRLVKTPFPGTLDVDSWHDPALANDPLAHTYTWRYADFLTPDTLYLAQTGKDASQRLKQRPSFFDAKGMRAEQRFARSKDGTRVPYFIVWGKGAKPDGRNPTVLYGYGGFENVEQPWYSGAFGQAWFERGGVLAVANIRGGGEYGPAWHQAALREKRQNAFDDFAAVAEDLIASKVASPRHLGIQGGSNGGLLVGTVMLQRPELFNAVLCQVPLLDMARYHLLLAGASWMAEYGDPSKAEDWAFLSRYSPYQNVRAGQKLPTVLFTTSTKDDRVHPGHARKMAARMAAQGHDLLYYENIEGGHAGAADNAQLADMRALEFAFLWQQLGPVKQP
jgi:prolyl oligopeptidase